MENRVKDLSDEELRRAIEEADIVFGDDKARGIRSLFYGREAMERIAESGVSEQLATLVLTFDSHTDELERICAFCQLVKGKDDYGDGDPHLPSVN